MKSKAPARRRYDASGRQAAAQITRDAIVSAALTRLRDVRPEQLSYADVAETSGVALRTVYRHFPTIEDLLGAVLRAFLQRFITKPLEELSPLELADMLETYHAMLSAEPWMYRLFFALPARSGAGVAALVERVCRDAFTRIPQEHRAAVCAAVELMIGPYAWETFHSHWQVPPAQITRTLLVGIQLLLDGFAARPQALALSSPAPPMFRAPNPRKRA
jgi:AcrR family transcriptional regulator